MEYVAIVKMSGMVTPDEWGTWVETFKATEDTTIGELVEKIRKQRPTLSDITFTVNTLK